jgi:hypothetical protein
MGSAYLALNVKYLQQAAIRQRRHVKINGGNDAAALKRNGSGGIVAAAAANKPWRKSKRGGAAPAPWAAAYACAARIAGMLAHGGGICRGSRVAPVTAAMAIARQAANNNGGIIKSMALWLWRSAAAWQRSNSESIGVGDPLSAASLIKISAAAINNGMKKHTLTAMAHRRRQRRHVAEMHA